MEKTIKVVMVEPMREPYPAEVENTLEGLQKAVGGYIEAVCLEDNVVLVCNEEGKLMGLPGNRSLGNDIIAGTFFVAGSNDDGEFVSWLKIKFSSTVINFKSRKPSPRSRRRVSPAISLLVFSK